MEYQLLGPSPFVKHSYKKRRWRRARPTAAWPKVSVWTLKELVLSLEAIPPNLEDHPMACKWLITMVIVTVSPQGNNGPLNTLPKTNRTLPLKIGLLPPRGNDRPTIHFQGRTVSFRVRFIVKGQWWLIIPQGG